MRHGLRGARASLRAYPCCGSLRESQLPAQEGCVLLEWQFLHSAGEHGCDGVGGPCSGCRRRKGGGRRHKGYGGPRRPIKLCALIPGAHTAAIPKCCAQGYAASPTCRVQQHTGEIATQSYAFRCLRRYSRRLRTQERWPRPRGLPQPPPRPLRPHLPQTGSQRRCVGLTSNRNTGRCPSRTKGGRLPCCAAANCTATVLVFDTTTEHRVDFSVVVHRLCVVRCR